eukprot:CAMPEP_0172875172 /NCGR_PEP_ID=MMETSP1075-20121228/100689_1 /TAXON_ID=2916 /ORGANISM="Ceratium fusus, Strain PA161109" /LENGTH=75 /DNA_ID=CAMNT_0013726163 /DNA_START=20 /DNA_END=245 /DNA_ORIENTATION=+
MGLGLRPGSDHDLTDGGVITTSWQTVVKHSQNGEEDTISKSTTPSTTATCIGAIAHDDDLPPDGRAEDALAPAHE